MSPHNGLVKDLHPLAVHSVLMAGEFNSSAVSAPEVAVCTIAKLKILTPDDLAPLIEISRAFPEHLDRPRA
jgi:hypothetical protein